MKVLSIQQLGNCNLSKWLFTLAIPGCCEMSKATDIDNIKRKNFQVFHPTAEVLPSDGLLACLEELELALEARREDIDFLNLTLTTDPTLTTGTPQVGPP